MHVKENVFSYYSKSRRLFLIVLKQLNYYYVLKSLLKHCIDPIDDVCTAHFILARIKVTNYLLYCEKNNVQPQPSFFFNVYDIYVEKQTEYDLLYYIPRQWLLLHLN